MAEIIRGDKTAIGSTTGFNARILGYESGTVGTVVDPRVRVNTQLSVKFYDPRVTADEQPVILGSFLFKWLQTPKSFHPSMVPGFLKYFEDAVKSVSGIPENSLDTVTVTSGAVRQEEIFTAGYKQSSGPFTIKVSEVTGMPVRKTGDYWVRMKSDNRTGAGHLNHRNMRNIKANTSGECLFVLLGPRRTPDDIEFACMWHGVELAKEIGYSAINSHDIGEAGSVGEVDVELNGTYEVGPGIDLIAKVMVKVAGLYKEDASKHRLPGYIIETILNKSEEDLVAIHGVDTDSKLARVDNQMILTEELQGIENDKRAITA